MIQGNDGEKRWSLWTETGTTEGVKPGILLQSFCKKFSSHYQVGGKVERDGQTRHSRGCWRRRRRRRTRFGSLSKVNDVFHAQHQLQGCAEENKRLACGQRIGSEVGVWTMRAFQKTFLYVLGTWQNSHQVPLRLKFGWGQPI